MMTKAVDLVQLMHRRKTALGHNKLMCWLMDFPNLKIKNGKHIFILFPCFLRTSTPNALTLTPYFVTQTIFCSC